MSIHFEFQLNRLVKPDCDSINLQVFPANLRWYPFFAPNICMCAIDVWRVMSKQINYEVFNKDSVKIAQELKSKVPSNALFLNAPTYNSAVVLTGRRSLMRYIGHLSSYGIDYEPRERELMRIYEGSALADSLLQKNNIEYVLISPDERNYMTQNNLILNEAFFQKYPKIAEFGEFRVYQIGNSRIGN